VASELKFEVTGVDSFRSALNAAGGWTPGEVLAAAIVRQGESPSIAGVATGLGLLKLLKRKGAKDLPRVFVLAATADQVHAFDASGIGSDDHDTYHVTIRPGEIASWPRSGVAMRDSKDGITANAVLLLNGSEVPVGVPNGNGNAAFEELQALLSAA
jgi:hypothetical protein